MLEIEGNPVFYLWRSPKEYFIIFTCIKKKHYIKDDLYKIWVLSI